MNELSALESVLKEGNATDVIENSARCGKHEHATKPSAGLIKFCSKKSRISASMAVINKGFPHHLRSQ